MAKIIGVDFKAGDDAAEQEARAALRAKWGNAAYRERISEAGRFKSIEWIAVDG
ncbi:hypothetical protein [Rhizobium ecuadorense]|uniref:hypothetical protein n=1 Tax=Rhizobium ecuadorense TaxID=1671795 RepID=UPI000B287E6E|nr:hypothetical protein [Rhizobium ecuadorense]